MSNPATQSESGVGAEISRVEDPGLLTGIAQFTDDLVEPRAAHAAIVSSQYGHATIEAIDTTEAEALDGVQVVITAEDMRVADRPMPNPIPVIPAPSIGMPPDHLRRPILADGKVRYQGEPVAVVLAEDRYVAHEASKLVDVQYGRLDAVVSPRQTLADDAPSIHDGSPDNLAFEWEYGDSDAMDAAIDEAAHVVDIEIANQRIIQNPIEPRAALAAYDPSTDKLTYKGTTQFVHQLRRGLSSILDHPEHRIHVIAPDMGGGFGGRAVINPEEPLVAWAAMHLERPVKWQGTRSQNYLNDVQGRGTETQGTLALDTDGNILGIRVYLLDDVGAYLSTFATGIAITAANVMTGQYDIPVVDYRVRGALTNTVPVDAYRGVIETELVHTLERLVEMAARETGIDPAQLRRRNFIPSDGFPYETVTGASYDSGDYEKPLDKALDLVNYEDLREHQSELRKEGRYIGIGFSAWLEKCGFGCAGPVTSWEYSNIQVHPSGGATVFCGTSNHGQGHSTTYAQIVSDDLGIPINKIEVIEDDTETVREGVGTFASRSALTAGGSLTRSTEKILEKGRQVAAHRFETAPEDVGFEDGAFFVRGAPNRSLSLAEVAEQAHVGYDIPDGMEPGMEATSYYDPEDYSFPFGIHVAVVEVDPETGEVEFERFVAVDDCGVQINPKIVEGQVHGGVAQGIGQALYEGATYDDNGNLASGSHMDYTLPKAYGLPEIETDYTVTPSPRNPLGAKGVGESGAVGALPATINAVEDALAPFDIEPMTPPLDNETVWRAVHDARTDQ